jgi:hypothetical protein
MRTISVAVVASTTSSAASFLTTPLKLLPRTLRQSPAEAPDEAAWKENCFKQVLLGPDPPICQIGADVSADIAETVAGDAAISRGGRLRLVPHITILMTATSLRAFVSAGRYRH